MNRIVWIIVFVMGLGFVGACSSMPNQGVEVGNPDLAGKKITLNIIETVEFYVISFDQEVKATVTQIRDGEYETQAGAFFIEGLLVLVSSLFNDGALFNANLLFDDELTLSSVDVTVNNEFMPSSFEVESSIPACVAGQSNAAITLGQALCSRVIACNQSYLCDDCELNVLAVPGLSAQFGDKGNSTLNESSQGIENNQVVVDEVNLMFCLLDINAIPCALVREKFNDNSLPNYNEIKNLIPKPSCSRGVLFDQGN